MLASIPWRSATIHEPCMSDQESTRGTLGSSVRRYLRDPPGNCEHALLRLVTWHVCGHSFASHLVMRGAPIKAVQELMGHSTILLTMRYAHLAPEVARETVQLRRSGGTGRGWAEFG
jgi:integrase